MIEIQRLSSKLMIDRFRMAFQALAPEVAVERE
jgi:hypothetical protein